MRITVVLALIALFTFPSDTFGQARRRADKETEQWRYELECVNQGMDGTYQIKIWSYSRKPHVAVEQAKKNAVHGVVFKGYPSSGRKCGAGQKPLMRDPSAEDTHATFFKEFFADKGDYMKYVSLTTDGAIAPGDIMKVGKRDYKVGIIVNVNKDLLRKFLESKGIVKGLSSGF